MASDNTASAPNPWQSISSRQTSSNVTCGWITLAASVVQTALLLLIAWTEQACASNTRMKPGLFSKINNIILVIIWANCASITLLFVAAKMTDPGFALACNMTGNFFNNGFQFAIVWYSWERGYYVVEKVHRPLIPYFRIALVVYGILQVTSGTIAFPNAYIPNLSLATRLANLTLAAETVAFFFDAGMLGIFVCYLKNSSSENLTQLSDVNRLALVARYGILSFCVSQLCMGSVVACNYFFAAPVPSASETTIMAVYDLNLYSPLLYSFVQLAMKWAIHSARQKVMMERLSATIIPCAGLLKAQESGSNDMMPWKYFRNPLSPSSSLS